MDDGVDLLFCNEQEALMLPTQKILILQLKSKIKEQHIHHQGANGAVVVIQLNNSMLLRSSYPCRRYQRCW